MVEMNTQKMIELFANGNNELRNKVRATLEFLGRYLSSFFTPMILISVRQEGQGQSIKVHSHPDFYQNRLLIGWTFMDLNPRPPSQFCIVGYDTCTIVIFSIIELKTIALRSFHH